MSPLDEERWRQTIKEALARAMSRISLSSSGPSYNMPDPEVLAERLIQEMLEPREDPSMDAEVVDSEQTSVSWRDLHDLSCEIRKCEKCDWAMSVPCAGFGYENCDVMAVLDVVDVDRSHEVKCELEGRGCRVYVTHLVKCRGVDPERISIDQVERRKAHMCQDYWLQREVELVKPKVILGLGEPFVTLVLGSRGVQRFLGEVTQIVIGDKAYPSVVTHHPAYVAEYEGTNLELRRSYRSAFDRVASISRGES